MRIFGYLAVIKGEINFQPTFPCELGCAFDESTSVFLCFFNLMCVELPTLYRLEMDSTCLQAIDVINTSSYINLLSVGPEDL